MGTKQKSFLDRPLKRGRTEAISNKTSGPPSRFPKFLVVHSEGDKQLSQMSPFLVAKVLESAVGKNYKAKKMNSGDLLVEVETNQQSTALLALTSVSGYDVSVSPHRTLNCIQGVISEDDLLDSSDSEIVEGLSDQGVTAARRITMRRDGKELKTRHVVLTFQSTVLPEAVRAGYLRCRVRPYVPNPRRCFKCQRFGHGSQSCRGKATCAKCSKTDHETDACTNDPRCINCSEPHPAYSRSCKTWKDEKEILTLKVKENLPYPEARRRFAFVRKGGYAQVVQRGPAPLRSTVATQTSSLDTGKPLQSPTPKLKIQLPGHSLSAGRSNDPSSQHTSALTGQQPVLPLVGCAQAASQSESQSAPTVSVHSSQSSPKERGRHSRPNSLERGSSKERRGSHAAPAAAKEQEQVDLGDSLPSTSLASSAGSGRGRGLPPRASSLPRSAGKASPLEVEAMDQGTELSTPASEQDHMEWQPSKTKQKSKKPVIAPK
ncbi:unnamed protein product [Ixodes hexagonus]